MKFLIALLSWCFVWKNHCYTWHLLPFCFFILNRGARPVCVLRGEREMTSEMSRVIRTADCKFGEEDDGVSPICLNAGCGVGTWNNSKKLFNFARSTIIGYERCGFFPGIGQWCVWSRCHKEQRGALGRSKVVSLLLLPTCDLRRVHSPRASLSLLVKCNKTTYFVRLLRLIR